MENVEFVQFIRSESILWHICVHTIISGLEILRNTTFSPQDVFVERNHCDINIFSSFCAKYFRSDSLVCICINLKAFTDISPSQWIINVFRRKAILIAHWKNGTKSKQKIQYEHRWSHIFTVRSSLPTFGRYSKTVRAFSLYFPQQLHPYFHNVLSNRLDWKWNKNRIPPSTQLENCLMNAFAEPWLDERELCWFPTVVSSVPTIALPLGVSNCNFSFVYLDMIRMRTAEGISFKNKTIQS